MKKVLVLNYEFPPLGGGASPVSYELAKKMFETGDFDIDVVTMNHKSLFKYEEINKTKRYDLCHCHFIIPTGVLALKLKKKFGLPYIITPHGSDVLNYNSRLKLIYPFLFGLWQNILNNAQKIISPSNFLKGEILKVYPLFEEKKIVVVPNGFDTNKFQPQVKKKYIFSSGRLLLNKGFQYLIQAVADEDIGYEVHLAGDGPMRKDLERLAKKSKTRIFFHGWLDNNGLEYKNLLEQAEIFVLISEKENASMVLREAMSAGCAIITSDTSGCAETVAEAGILVKFGDVQVLKSALNLLVNDQNQLLSLAEKALTRVKNTYDWQLIVKEYIKNL